MQHETQSYEYEQNLSDARACTHANMVGPPGSKVGDDYRVVPRIHRIGPWLVEARKSTDVCESSAAEKQLSVAR